MKRTWRYPTHIFDITVLLRTTFLSSCNFWCPIKIPLKEEGWNWQKIGRENFSLQKHHRQQCISDLIVTSEAKMGKVSLISATVLLWVVRWRDNLKSKLLEDCIFRKLSTADEMDQVLSSQACCHWAYNGEKYGKSQISSCTFTNTVPNNAPRSQLPGTYSKVVAWLHASSLPFR